MKKFTLTMSLAAVALFAVPTTTFAEDTAAGAPPQGAARPGAARWMDPEARLKMMTEKLGLDADQQAKIKAIQDKNAPKFKELMAKGRENLTDADKTELRELMTAQFEEVKAVLTPAQVEKMKELRAQGRGGPKAGEAKPATE